MHMVDEMLPVAEIMESYPEGTHLNVWFKRACEGTLPQYGGVFVVADNNLKDPESGRRWGESWDRPTKRQEPIYIVRVEVAEATI